MKRKECINTVRLQFPARSVNEALARSVVGVALAAMDPTVEEMADIRCAVSEAVTNAVVHAYKEKEGEVYISVRMYADRSVQIEVRDRGCGIADVEEARQPLFTTKPEGERSGMGFSVMETFMDTLTVLSAPGKGTRVVMGKKLSDEYGRRKISG